MLPVIVLSSHTVGLAVIRSLGKVGVPVYVVYYDNNDMGYVSKYVKKAFLVPDPETDESGFIKKLIEISEGIGPNLLFPADDSTLLTVSRNKDILEKYGLVSCPNWGVIQTLLDKKYTYELAPKIGVPCPKTIALESEESLRSHKDSIEYPCLIKPCFSHKFYKIFNKKLFKVSDFSEALQAYDKAASAGVEVMLQEFIPGNDDLGVNYNSFFCNGRPVVEFTAQKVRLSPPGSGIPRVVINKVIPEVVQYGRDIVKGIGFEGYSCTEFKKDPRDGGYKLLEVNGRHNRSSLLSLRCGINFPWLEYNYMVNGELLTAAQSDEEIYWIDEFKDFYEFIFNHRTEKLSFSAFLQPYLKKNIFANFDAGDLLPFKQRAISLFRSKIIERFKSEKFM